MRKISHLKISMLVQNIYVSNWKERNLFVFTNKLLMFNVYVDRTALFILVKYILWSFLIVQFTFYYSFT